MPELHTTRLIIDYLRISDAAFTLDLLNDPDFIAHIGDRNIRSLEAAQEYLDEGPVASYRDHGFGMYIVRRKENGNPVGMCGLVKREGLEDIDIGYAFSTEARGQGYALEAALAVRDYAMDVLALDTLVAVVDPANAPSISLLRKLGMRFESMVRLTPDDDEICLFRLPTDGE